MEIKSAVFQRSANKLSDCPTEYLPEYAFIGRSNVGKSSLINMLVTKKQLARTSSTPGKTVSLNYYKINENWFLVDLPGYGYAKRSKTLRTEWEATLENYLRKRENLQCVFVLVDSRVPPQISDLSFINLLGEIGVPFAIVFTKLDKLKPAQAQANIVAFEEEMLKDWAAMPQVFQTSSEKKIGREDLLDYISQISKSFNVAKG